MRSTESEVPLLAGGGRARVRVRRRGRSRPRPRPREAGHAEGKVNIKGTKDMSSKSTAKLEHGGGRQVLRAHVHEGARRARRSPLELENEGKAPHTFTSDGAGVDQEVAPGKKAKLTFTVPSDGKVFQFHCTFHETRHGGGVYTKAACEHDDDR